MSIEYAVALGLLKNQLSGFKGFPRETAGLNRFAEVLSESALSVEHAMATVNAFDEIFPTVRNIRETAFNLRPKYEAALDQKAEWERIYGKPDPGWSRRLERATIGDYPDQKRAMLWQAIRDSLYYTEGPGRNPNDFWAKAAASHLADHPQEVQEFREQLKASSWDELMKVDWLKTMPKLAARKRPVSVPVITQEDIDRELRAQGREPGDDDE